LEDLASSDFSGLGRILDLPLGSVDTGDLLRIRSAIKGLKEKEDKERADFIQSLKELDINSFIK
jgi:hypothetical protein